MRRDALAEGWAVRRRLRRWGISFAAVAAVAAIMAPVGWGVTCNSSSITYTTNTSYGSFEHYVIDTWGYGCTYPIAVTVNGIGWSNWSNTCYSDHTSSEWWNAYQGTGTWTIVISYSSTNWCTNPDGKVTIS